MSVLSGEFLCRELSILTSLGHQQPVVSLAWEPLHRNPEAPRLLSGSKDKMAKVWQVRAKRCEFTMARHTEGVSSNTTVVVLVAVVLVAVVVVIAVVVVTVIVMSVF